MVRFTSDALETVEEFDWEYIAGKDALQKETGWGYDPNVATKPEEPPPSGHTTKIRFPLTAKKRIMMDGGAIWLHAELHWGGVKQDSTKVDIRRVYQREDGKGPPATM